MYLSIKNGNDNLILIMDRPIAIGGRYLVLEKINVDEGKVAAIGMVSKEEFESGDYKLGNMVVITRDMQSFDYNIGSSLVEITVLSSGDM